MAARRLSRKPLWVAAAAALAATAAYALLPVPVLLVTAPDDPQPLWRVVMREGATVDLNYTNSLFNASTTERFVVTGNFLRLVEINSTQRAVLEYLALDPPYETRDGRVVSKRRGPLFAELTIRIGQTGQQSLVIDGRELPLYQVGTGEAVRVAVTRVPRLRLLARR